jgi:hypothetical protein
VSKPLKKHYLAILKARDMQSIIAAIPTATSARRQKIEGRRQEAEGRSKESLYSKLFRL